MITEKLVKNYKKRKKEKKMIHRQAKTIKIGKHNKNK